MGIIRGKRCSTRKLTNYADWPIVTSRATNAKNADLAIKRLQFTVISLGIVNGVLEVFARGIGGVVKEGGRRRSASVALSVVFR